MNKKGNTLGVMPFIVIILSLILAVFFFYFGERLNPFDGKTWSDFKQAEQSTQSESN